MSSSSRRDASAATGIDAAARLVGCSTTTPEVPERAGQIASKVPRRLTMKVASRFVCGLLGGIRQRTPDARHIRSRPASQARKAVTRGFSAEAAEPGAESPHTATLPGQRRKALSLS
jgi:hypothetical protein